MYPRIFVWFYDAAIRMMLGFIRWRALFHPKARQWHNGRKKQAAIMSDLLRPDAPCLWFHCASAGEFEQGRPLLEALRRQFPDRRYVLTFFSPSGYERYQNEPLADAVLYLPADTAAAMRRFIGLLNPQLVVLVKYEFWYHMLAELLNRKIPVVVAAAHFNENHYIFHPLFAPLRRLLQNLTLLLVQDEASAVVLQRRGFGNVAVAGDSRADRVWQIAQEPASFPVVEQFAGTDPVLVAGSTWPRDEALLLAAFRWLPQNWKMVVVPHEHSPTSLRRLAHQAGEACLYSEAERAPCRARILIVDRMGLLSRLYRYATVTYVGGGFDRGIHNVLEAAVYGRPVLFGPKFQRFTEAVQLLQQGKAAVIRTPGQLLQALSEFDASGFNADKNRDLVRQRAGATKRMLTYITPLLTTPQPVRSSSGAG